MTKIVVDITHVARLANLSLSPKELNLYTKQLEQIVEYIGQLDQVDTSKVTPTFQTIDNTTNVFRKDEITPSLSQAEALSSAKQTHHGYFTTSHVNETLPKRKLIDQFNAVLTQVNHNGQVAHKDLFITKGIETTAGSKVLQGYIPQYSSTVVDLLAKAGLVTRYKTNEDAWGHGSSGENSDFGPTKNPWNLAYVPGGSSSGSAAAVAAGLVDVATGTDTGSSIRLPASFTNTTGIKPTYGALSRWGVIAFVSSLDCPGLIANSVKKLRRYYSIVAQEDKYDCNTCSPLRYRKPIKHIKTIGLPREYFGAGVDKQVAQIVSKAASDLAKAGYQLKTVSLPHTQYGVAAYYIIAPTEASSNLARYDGIRYGNNRQFFGPEAKRRIILGTFASSAGYAAKYYEKAAKVRTLIIKDFNQAFKQVDTLLAPVSPTPPFKIGAKANDPLQMYLSDALTIPVNLAGIPALSLPCGFTDNKLPIGLQIIGPRWSEESLFDLGEKYQSLTNWHTKKPKL